MKDKIIEGFKIITGVRYREIKGEWEEQNILIDTLRCDNYELRGKIKDLKKKYEEKEKELRLEYVNDVERLRSEIKELKKKHKEKIDDFSLGIANKDKELFIAHNEIEELKEQIETLKDELNRNDSELIEANTKITIMEGKLQEQDYLIQDLKTCLEQANSTDNVQPDSDEPIITTEIDQRPDGLIFSSDELCVTDIEVIPNKVNLNPEDLNLTFSKINEGLGSFVVRTSEKTEEAPKKKGRTKKATGAIKTTKTKTTTTNKTSKKKK